MNPANLQIMKCINVGFEEKCFRKMGNSIIHYNKKASTDNIIILPSVDSGYVDMAINFKTSFKRFNINLDSLAVKIC